MPKLKKKSADQKKEEMRNVAIQRRAEARSILVRREAEKQQDADAHRLHALPARREAEVKMPRKKGRQSTTKNNQKQRECMQKLRDNKDYRTAERQKDCESKRRRRLDDEAQSQDRETNHASMKKRRMNHTIRSQERHQDAAARAEQREDNDVRQRDRVVNHLSLQKRREDMPFNSLLQQFHQEIRMAPIHPCSSCGCVYYPDNIVQLTDADIMKKGLTDDFLDKVRCVHLDNLQFCRTCRRHIMDKKIPTLCLSNGLAFPEVPQCLMDLTALEERLVALRIVFMHIKAVGSEQQLKLKGNIVNLENDLDVCAKAIPRRFDEMATVQLRFKRRLRDERHVWYEVIRPAFVERAKQFLLQQELYVENGVEARDDYEDADDDSQLQFIVPESREYNDELDVDATDHNDNDEDGEEVGADETLILNSLGSNYLDIAPGEGKIPKPLYEDPLAEEMANPKIYAGQKRKIKKEAKLSYTDIAKSECLREDRRCAAPAKVLYAFKKSFNEKMRTAVQIFLRKRRGNRKVTAKQAQDKDFLKTLVDHDEGYGIWKDLRSSPSYWANKSKDVISMVRQLGKCAIFITFSAAETRWTELLVILEKLLVGNGITEEQAAALAAKDKADMIRNDPITCMRHFDRRIRKAHLLLMKRINGIFAPYKMKDYFRRTEFQMRGSPHSHGLYWIENAPEYDEKDPSSIERCRVFIDHFITVENCHDGPMEYLIKMQTHSHSATCKYKEGKRECRFGYPLPPLPETTILEPLSKETSNATKKQLKELYKTIQANLTERTKSNNTDICFDDYLQSLNVSKEEYYKAIRSSIQRTTVFHKRHVNAAFINRYNRTLLEAWGANIDVQYVTNTFACAKYCVGYILKSDGGISKLMKEANREARGNPEIREKLKAFAKALLNGTEISAQEAAGFLLGIQNTDSSRMVEFINTNPPEERIGILKSASELAQLPDDSEDICQRGKLDRYINRPAELENTCLAEFISMYEFEKRGGRADRPEEQEHHFDADVAVLNELFSKRMPRYHMLDNSGSMRRRTKGKVIRFRSYSRRLDPRNYWREQLMLFVPWRNEEEELLTIDTIETAQRQLPVIVENSTPYYKDRNLGDQEIQAYADEAGEETGEEEKPNDAHWEEEEEILADAIVNPGPSSKAQTTKVDKFLLPNMLPDVDYLRLMRSLNVRQRRIVLDILHRLKTSPDDETCLFLSGGAGVGKSHVITAIVQSTIRYFNGVSGRDLSQPPVIVVAFTGKAAFNVLGMTIHHVMRLWPNQRKYERLPDLDASTLNSIRKKLGGLKLLIIDEISMVSVRMLYEIDQRLRQIMGNNKPFGGILIVVVGHFRQLAPIAAAYVFDVPFHLPNGAVVGNYLWRDNFSFYELNEIMRQRGEKEFCDALNNMSEGVMTDGDIALIKSREINEDLMPPEGAVWLFRTNVECTAHNQLVHGRLGTEGAMSYATDQVQGSGTEQAKNSLLEAAKSWYASECDGLRYETYLKVGGEYFISTNINVSDGLFNGATGTLKAIEYSAQTLEPKPLRTWIDFKNPLIGSMKRKAAARLVNRRAAENGDYRNWVPVGRIKKTLTKSFVYQGLQVVRSQIPLTACNGMTVAKCQGSTLQCVVVSTRGTGHKKFSRQELYVACSRATSLTGLFIDGEFVAHQKPNDDDPVTLELARIQSNPYRFKLQFLQDIPEYDHKFYYHNVQSLISHLKDVVSDPCVTSADLISFVEPHLLDTDQLDFPGYDTIQRTNCRTQRNSEGALVLLKENTPTTSATALPTVIKEVSGSGHCIFVTVKYGGLSIVIMYKSPTFPKTRFRKILSQSLSVVHEDALYIGDINLNLADGNGINDDIIQIFDECGLRSQLNVKIPTTNGGSHIDVAFSDVSYLNCWLYESYYSYHKPIVVVWPKFEL